MRLPDCETGVTWPQALHDVGMGFVGLGGAWLAYKFLRYFLTGDD